MEPGSILVRGLDGEPTPKLPVITSGHNKCINGYYGPYESAAVALQYFQDMARFDETVALVYRSRAELETIARATLALRLEGKNNYAKK